MKKHTEIALYIVWLCLYIICVGLGAAVPEAEGFGKVAMILTALIFFIPGITLLVMGLRNKDRKVLFRLRLVTILSLVLTMGALIGTMMTAAADSSAAAVMADLLTLVSAPMVCGQYWALSLFCWAALMMATIPGVILQKKQK